MSDRSAKSRELSVFIAVKPQSRIYEGRFDTVQETRDFPYFNRPFNGFSQRMEPYDRLNKRLGGGRSIGVCLNSIDDV